MIGGGGGYPGYAASGAGGGGGQNLVDLGGSVGTSDRSGDGLVVLEWVEGDDSCIPPQPSPTTAAPAPVATEPRFTG